MLRIQRHHLDAVHGAGEASELWPAVQSAIELEHATIPPYLTALLSIKQGYNVAAARIIGSVVREEMLHMAIACNLLNALGGTPRIDDPAFLPKYPGALPMGVRSELTVGLEKLTRRVVHGVFMSIEEPEDPIDIPVRAALGSAEAVAIPENATIGQFYAAISEKLVEWENGGKNPIVGDPKRQIADPDWYPEKQLFPIHSVTDAVRAIDVIVEQGEGTSTSPLDASGEVAHFYRFGEIVYGKTIVAVPTPPGWAYAGTPVALDPAGVWDLLSDAKAVDFPETTRARVLVDLFNTAYTNLLRCLDRVFNGEPGQLEMALSVMVEMQLTGQKLVTTPVPGTGKYAAPTFEYTPFS